MHTNIKSLVYLLALATVHAQSSSKDPGVDKIDPDYINVSYGSFIKLSHAKTNAKLHSHKIPYGSGSGQQSVTGLPRADDPNSYWLVEPQVNTLAARGEPVPCNAVIRLLHSSTSAYLHSHLHKSPISSNTEVSAFPALQSNSDDHWQVQCKGADQRQWQREEPVYLQHVSTSTYLHSSPKHTYNQPIPGQLEVCGVSKKTALCEWVAKEGFYYNQQ